MSLVVPIAEATLAVLTLIGVIAAAARWLRDSGADAARLDARLASQDTRLASIEKNLKPNGKDTQQVGDIVARTEEKLDELGTKLDQHIGAEAEARAQIWQEFRTIRREGRSTT